MTAVAYRRGFTLTELLVAVAVVLGLMTLLGGAVAAARGSQKKQATQALIARLDAIIQQQYSSYATRTVSGSTAGIMAAARRQLATADMPDNWSEVQTLKEGTTSLVGATGKTFPLNAPQRAYVQYRDGISGLTSQFGDAECLFMIVMLGGLADCLDCGGLALSEIGDKDGDSALEFLDAWGNPIGFVLWPAGLELPPNSGKFFSTTAPFSDGAAAVASGGVMRPLIYSRGPDGLASLSVPAASQLKTGTNCGNPADATTATFGGLSGSSDSRADNITNFDTEVRR